MVCRSCFTGLSRTGLDPCRRLPVLLCACRLRALRRVARFAFFLLTESALRLIDHRRSKCPIICSRQPSTNSTRPARACCDTRRRSCTPGSIMFLFSFSSARRDIPVVTTPFRGIINPHASTIAPQSVKRSPRMSNHCGFKVDYLIFVL